LGGSIENNDNGNGNSKNKQQQEPIQWSIRFAQDDESFGDAGFCKNKQQRRSIVDCYEKRSWKICL